MADSKQTVVTQQQVTSDDADDSVADTKKPGIDTHKAVADTNNASVATQKAGVDTHKAVAETTTVEAKRAGDTQNWSDVYVPADKLSTWSRESLLKLAIHLMEAREKRRQRHFEYSKTAKRKACNRRCYYVSKDTYHPEYNPTGTHEKKWRRSYAPLVKPDNEIQQP